MAGTKPKRYKEELHLRITDEIDEMVRSWSETVELVRQSRDEQSE